VPFPAGLAGAFPRIAATSKDMTSAAEALRANFCEDWMETDEVVRRAVRAKDLLAEPGCLAPASAAALARTTGE